MLTFEKLYSLKEKSIQENMLSRNELSSRFPHLIPPDFITDNAHKVVWVVFWIQGALDVRFFVWYKD